MISTHERTYLSLMTLATLCLHLTRIGFAIGGIAAGVGAIIAAVILVRSHGHHGSDHPDDKGGRGGPGGISL